MESLVAPLAVIALASSAAAADRSHPAVVELFQSQGCSSCPPANANFMPLADRPDVLPLSFQVTYWDRLGWKDTFDDPAFTARQWEYAHAWKQAQVATPQVVVNGRSSVVGAAKGEIEGLLAKADRGDGGPALQVSGRQVSLSGTAPVRAAAVWLVRYDPRVVQVAIQRGENGGRTLPHRNVVRELVHLGDWKGGDRSYTLPSPRTGGLRTAVLVQDGPGGPILAAARG